MITISLIPLLVACQCEHQWDPATCKKPRECLRCGITEGERLNHQYKDATCLYPKTCVHCEKTDGFAKGHQWLEATCTSSQKCKICYEVSGEPLSHSYEKGTCKHCGYKDPNFLNDFGFINNYGMTTWLEITGYSFTNGYVYESGIYHRDFSFDTELLYTGDIINGKLERKSERNSVLGLSIKGNTQMHFYAESKTGTWLIYDRVLSNDKKYVIVKTQLAGSEKWYIPSDLIDWEKSSVYDKENNRTIYYLKK